VWVRVAPSWLPPRFAEEYAYADMAFPPVCTYTDPTVVNPEVLSEIVDDAELTTEPETELSSTNSVL
jgi:hypothetical protein